MRELRFFSDTIAEEFGHPLRRIPLDAGFSCPHRDNRKTGGCLFCSPNGSRAAHLQDSMTREEQIRSGIALAQHLYDAKPPYIAYFQAYTSTNAPAEQIRYMLEETARLADFPVIILGTRPDCLPEDTLDVLEEWSHRVQLWVELGVQTACDETLKRINRGHDFACSERAIRQLHARGIHTAAHLILGLPGETREIMMETADRIAALPVDAVKMHNLLVLRGTKLAAMNPPTLNEYEYADLLAAFLKRLPDSVQLMRLAADAPEESILAPKWWMNKSQFLELFRHVFSSGIEAKFMPCRTGDGSYTLYHPRYRQHFHSLAGAREESVRKYLNPLKIGEKLAAGQNVRILEIGFGLGFNAGAACRIAEEAGAGGRLSFLSLENDPNVLQASLTLPEHHAPEMIRSLTEKGVWRTAHSEVTICFGDARVTLPQIPGPFDAVFLDGFSPDTNPELWTQDFLNLLKSKLKPGGAVAAYSSAYPVAGGFLAAGFELHITKPFGRKRPGLAAFVPPSDTDLEPYPEKDRNITTKSTAGIPYRDPGLNHTREEIFQLRKEETSRLREAGMPKWYR